MKKIYQLSGVATQRTEHREAKLVAHPCNPSSLEAKIELCASRLARTPEKKILLKLSLLPK